MNLPGPQPIPPPVVDLSFPHRWQAEILPARPLILPPRHFVYPRQAEEVERGALEVLVRPNAIPATRPIHAAQTTEKLDPASPSRQGTTLVVPKEQKSELGALAPEECFSDAPPFLATCALGFRDPAVPTGLWSTPNPEEICAVAGGYAYLIDAANPDRFTMLPYRPVLEVRPLPAEGLLLFVGHHGILAWGRDGLAWQSGKLSDEGVTISSVESGVLRGLGWDLRTDKETPFALELRTGLRVS
jgi:hypothetical protein